MRDARTTPVSAIMTRHVLTTTPGAPVRLAAQTMLDQGVSGLPVLDADHNVVGVVTLSDVVYALSRPPSPPPSRPAGRLYAGDAELLGLVRWLFPVETLGQAAVSEFMTETVVSVSASDSIEVAARVMHDNLVHRVLVVEGVRPIGIVTSMDILAWIAEGPPDDQPVSGT